MDTVREGRVWKLSPSDLFLYGNCRRCLWPKAVRGLNRPRGGFPKVFGLLDRQTKDHLCRRRAEEIAPGIPPGNVLCRDRSVRSVPLEVPGHASRVRLTGRLDTALALDDGSYGLIDFKTSVPRPGLVATYLDQLTAYGLALEQPDTGALGAAPITQLGLVVVEPVGMIDVGNDVAFRSVPTWLEVERDDERFFDLLSQVLLVLELTAPPEPAHDCPYCEYVLQGALVVLEQLEREG